jgi:tetratricopeptide (TPR) repeat protein
MSASRQLSLPLSGAIVIIATLLAFWPVVTCDFLTWDDLETVALNPRIVLPTARTLTEVWTRPHMDLYIPLTYSLWALTANAARKPAPPPAPPPAQQPTSPDASPLDARPFHALNLLLHATAACIVLLLLRMLIDHPPAALVGSLLFALHPLQVEPVAWVSGTKDVLFALLALIALWQYAAYAKASATGERLMRSERVRMLGIATVAFILAMLSKPTAIVTPLIALVLDRLVIGRPWRDVLRTLWPWFVLTLPCILWTRNVQRAELAARMAPSLLLRPLVALDALAFYISKLLWPKTLIFDYGRTPQHIIDHRFIAWTWIVPALIALAALYLARKKSFLPAAAAMIFVIVLLPVLGLAPFDFQAYSTVADHYLYLAMLGPALLLAWIVAHWPSRGIYAAVIATLLALALRTHAQTKHWQNSTAFFTHALQHNPRSFVSLSNLATMAMNRGDTTAAIELSQKALAIRPFAAAYLTLADAMRSRGDLQSAFDLYQKALQAEPDYGPALNNVAAMLAERGQLQQALPYAERAAALQPDSIPAQLNLGRMYFQLNQPAKARRQFEAVLKLDPANTAARELLTALP